MSSSAFSNWAKIVTCHVSAPQREQNLLPRDHSACLENVASLLRRAKLKRVRTNFVWKNLSWTRLSFTRDPRNRASFWTSKRAKICMVSRKKYRHKLSGCNNPVQRGCKDKRYLITWSVLIWWTRYTYRLQQDLRNRTHCFPCPWGPSF